MNPLVLDATTKSIEAVMSGAAATTNPSVTAGWADDTGSAFTEGASDTALNDTTPVTLVAAPAAATRRVIKYITICNVDTAPVTVRISYNNNSTLRRIATVTLAVGDTWTTDGTYDTSGNLKTAVSGSATLTIGSTVVNSGTSTRILYDNAGVLGEYTLTGSGTAVAMGTAPVFTTNISTPAVLATANDSGALGASGTAFADLFLATGGIINWAANNSNITHSSGILTVGAGEFRITSANVGTNNDSVPTLSSTSTMTNKTLTAPTLGGATSLADGATLKMIVPTVDGTFTGPSTAAFVSGYTSSAIGDLVYLDSAGKWQKTDSDALATTTGLLGIAMAVAATDAALLVALPGSIVYATAFPTLTIGAPYYVGETPGAIQSAIPTGADNAVRVVGFGVHADKLFFLPSSDTSTTVA